MNNADLIVATLKAAGVDRGFGIPSGNVLPLMEAMRSGGIDFVLTAHEGSAGFAADVTGRLTESLGGVRVVKGYHAESREADVFAGGVARILENILKTLTATSVLSLASTVLLGVVGAAVLFVGARQILDGALTVGGLFTYTILLGFLVGPVFQIVSTSQGVLMSSRPSSSFE